MQEASPPPETAMPAQTEQNLSSTPSPQVTKAEAAFNQLDSSLFLWTVTRNAATQHQFVSDTEAYGVDSSLISQTWGDFSPEAAEAYAAECRTHMESLQALPAGLSAQKESAKEAALFWLEAEAEAAADWLYFEALTPQTGVHCQMPTYFLRFAPQNAADAELYLSLLADLPRYFAQIAEHEKARADAGLFMTVRALDFVLAECEVFLSETLLAALGNRFAADLEALTLSEEERALLQVRHAEQLQDAYIPAYQSLMQSLRALAPQCRAEGGQLSLGTEAWFARALTREANAKLSPVAALQLLEATASDLFAALQSLHILYPALPLPPPLPNEMGGTAEIPLRHMDAYEGLPALLYIPGTVDAPTGFFALSGEEGADTLLWAHENAHAAAYIAAMENPTVPLFQKTLHFPAVWEGNALVAAQSAADLLSDADRDTYLMAFYYERYQDVCGALASILVNALGYDASTLRAYLSERGMEDGADALYAQAVDNPLHYFRYALGYAQALEKERENILTPFATLKTNGELD